MEVIKTIKVHRATTASVIDVPSEEVTVIPSEDAQIIEAEEQLEAAGLNVFHHIRRSDKVDSMTFQQEPLLISSPRSAAGVDYRKFVAEYMKGGAV